MKSRATYYFPGIFGGAGSFLLICQGASTESISWFIEDQAFSPSYSLAPPPPSPPLPADFCHTFSVFRCVARSNLLTEEREGDGRGAKSYDVEKAWSSVNNSILSGQVYIGDDSYQVGFSRRILHCSESSLYILSSEKKLSEPIQACILKNNFLCKDQGSVYQRPKNRKNKMWKNDFQNYKRYCPARLIRRKLGSLDRSSLKSQARRFFDKFTRLLLVWITWRWKFIAP